MHRPFKTAISIWASALCAAACVASTPDDSEDIELEQIEQAFAPLSLPRGLPLVSAKASTSDTNRPGGAIDGDAATRWSGMGAGAEITFELVSAATLAELNVAWYRAAARRTTFEVFTSEDGATFKSVITKRQSTQGVIVERYDLRGTKARFVRVRGYGNTENSWTSIVDVSVRGTASSDPPIPPQPPPQPGVPASLIDLTNWKITLPVAAAGSSTPLEVKQPTLASYALAPYFWLSQGFVVFRAHAGGVTTSNSGYPRSELREMTAGGTQNASWSTTSGKHTMDLSVAITHLPEKKPHVVVGQIHDSADDVVMVRLEGMHLFVEGGGKPLGDLDTAYQLGTRFSTTIHAENGHILVSYNGQPKVDLARNATGCYFKAGMYTQSNPSRGDTDAAYGQANVYALRVSHQ